MREYENFVEMEVCTAAKNGEFDSFRVDRPLKAPITAATPYSSVCYTVKNTEQNEKRNVNS